MKELILRYDEGAGAWREVKEPYITIEVETEEDFISIQEAVKKQHPMKLKAHTTSGAYGRCPRCNELVKSYYAKYCDQCGQKLDWSERR